MYAFRDTLDAGEARLIQVFDDSLGLDADVRITDPDVNAILPARNDTLLDSRSVPGETVDILARFYNMGTEPKNNVRVFLVDGAAGDTLDSDVISFGGLSTSSCYTPDMEEASFTWTPDSTDIGVHVLRVSAQTWPGEPDPSDNTATLVHLVDPRDYATEVLGNPWDMTEATGHLWHTDDIVETAGWNDSAFTDSVSGMFEGVLSESVCVRRPCSEHRFGLGRLDRQRAVQAVQPGREGRRPVEHPSVLGGQPRRHQLR